MENKATKKRQYRPLKHATVIQFGRILGECDFRTQAELDNWLNETNLIYFVQSDMCLVDIENKKPKRRYYRKKKATKEA